MNCIPNRLSNHEFALSICQDFFKLHYFVLIKLNLFFVHLKIFYLSYYRYKTLRYKGTMLRFSKHLFYSSACYYICLIRYPMYLRITVLYSDLPIVFFSKKPDAKGMHVEKWFMIFYHYNVFDWTSIKISYMKIHW